MKAEGPSYEWLLNSPLGLGVPSVLFGECCWIGIECAGWKSVPIGGTPLASANSFEAL